MRGSWIPPGQKRSWTLTSEKKSTFHASYGQYGADLSTLTDRGETDTETVPIQREERGGQRQGRTDRLGGSRASWETGESKLIPLICNRLRRLGGVCRK